MAFQLVIGAFPEGASIPKLHTCEGADVSPAIEWQGAPDGTRSFVLVVDDPDAPSGVWNHWLLYDIPASQHTLPQGWKPGGPGVSGTNDFGKQGYGGPCPPPGHGPHRYFFKLFAMAVESLGLPAGARRAAIDKAMSGHYLAEAEYMGIYERK